MVKEKYVLEPLCYMLLYIYGAQKRQPTFYVLISENIIQTDW